jgi:hypothetical protein
LFSMCACICVLFVVELYRDKLYNLLLIVRAYHVALLRHEKNSRLASDTKTNLSILC